MGKGRARLVAWRTTHHRPGRVVGETNGLPTYSIAGVKVVLLPRSRHFRRVVGCARCGAPAIDRSHPVYQRRDLRAASGVVCDTCAGIPMQPASREDGAPDARPDSAS